ncbi:MAG TPA: sulfite exporter TauE/SafE family protein [Quisquiliibacterium sp.]|nr:sulfite exporter TauE/SafE family protein [Quisquiliibacterium sp.]
MAEVTLLSVFLVGLLGGLHCASMCGGIVSVMSMAASRGRAPDGPQAAAGPAPRVIPIVPVRRTTPLPVLLGYNLGRILSYTIAGGLAGAVGSTAFLARGVLPVQQVAFVAANLVLIGMGLYLTGALRSVAVLELAGQGLWRTLRPLASRMLAADRFGRAFAAGMVWGWVPCGMVYGVLIAALVSGSPFDGAALALAFGLGTLPNLLALGWSAHAARRWLGHRAVRIAAGVLVIAFGLAGLARLDPLDHVHQVVDACLSFF